jgi:hypothetical protein
MQFGIRIKSRVFHLGSESVDWDSFVEIVVENNVANRGQSLLILIWLLRIQVVQRAGGFWVSVRPGKVDTCDHGNV